MANKQFTVKLFNPTGGAIVDAPNPANVSFTYDLSLYSPVASVFAVSGSTNDPMRVMMWDRSAARFYLHYLDGFEYQASSPDGWLVRRVGPDTLMVLSYANVAGTHRVHVDLYSINAMKVQGAAYSAGAGSMAAAIKATPYANAEFDSNASSDVATVNYATYDGNHFYLMNRYKIGKVNLTTGAITTVSVPSITGFASAPRLEEQFYSRCYIASDGYLVCQLRDGATSDYAMVKLNPDTGALVYKSAEDGTIYWRNAPLANGSVVFADGINNRLKRITADLATITDLGALTLSGDLFEVNASDAILCYSGNRLKRLAIGASSFTESNDYFGETTEKFCSFLTASTFGNWIGSGGTATVKSFNVDGTELTTASMLDHYNAHTVDAVVNSNMADSGQPDAFYYYPVSVGGTA